MFVTWILPTRQQILNSNLHGHDIFTGFKMLRYFDTVYLSLKPHKCDQCDKSIEAVGNEHSFQYYENIKKERSFS